MLLVFILVLHLCALLKVILHNIYKNHWHELIHSKNQTVQIFFKVPLLYENVVKVVIVYYFKRYFKLYYNYILPVGMYRKYNSHWVCMNQS